MCRFALLAGLFWVTATPALASTITETPYEIDPVIDTVGTAGLFLFVGVLDGLVKPSLSSKGDCIQKEGSSLCDPKSLLAFDRSVVGTYSRSWQHVSDWTSYVGYSLPIIGGALDYFVGDEQGSAGDWATDMLVVGQAVGVTILITDIFKYALRRPRPTRYTEGAYSGSSEHLLSFPSGHTSSTAAAAFAYASTFTLRHPNSPWLYGVWGSAAAITGVTGLARVQGGMHFYTDIAAGIFLGATVGILVPYLHRKKEANLLSVVPTVSPDGGGIRVTGQF